MDTYNNILAEMVRLDISRRKMAEYLGIAVCTFNKKLNKKIDFTLDETLKMQQIFNSNRCTIEYLFENEKVV